jgi:hypothetical protein
MKTMLRPAALLFLVLASPAWSIDQQFLQPVVPIDSSLKGMGGVSTGNAEGWSALFVNPAAFANPTSSATLGSLGVTGYLPLAGLNEVLAAHESWGTPNFTTPNDPMTNLINSLLTSYGVGGEATLGGGWVGNNFGLGVLIEARSYGKGPNVLGTQDTLEQSTELVIGGAIPINIGLGSFKVGASVRPQQKAYSVVAATDLLNYVKGDTSPLMNETLYAGYALGWDIGARWDYAGFKTGLVIRDLGSTLYNFQGYKVKDWLSHFGIVSNGTDSPTNFRVPTVIAVGSAWSPDVGALASVIQPTVGLDFQIPIKVQTPNIEPSFWTWTHVGGEVKFLRILAVRAGLNQGYFTFGMGVSVPYFDFNFAVYTDEMGQYSGLNPRSSISLDWTAHL